jgi:hypothetical protein
MEEKYIFSLSVQYNCLRVGFHVARSLVHYAINLAFIHTHAGSSIDHLVFTKAQRGRSGREREIAHVSDRRHTTPKSLRIQNNRGSVNTVLASTDGGSNLLSLPRRLDLSFTHPPSVAHNDSIWDYCVRLKLLDQQTLVTCPGLQSYCHVSATIQTRDSLAPTKARPRRRTG